MTSAILSPSSSSMDEISVATGAVTSTDDGKAGDIAEPFAEDVLCGRGGSINSHPGNEKFRLLVEQRKRVYLTARFKREKRLIANAIVNEIRASKGRFLTRDTKTGLWKDIGDEKARDKTSQALRENAPSIRAEIEEEINEQRAELYKDERQGNHNGQYPYPPPPPNHASYYNGWYPPYFTGYAHPPPPPPPPHLQSGYHHPPPPGYLPGHPPPPPPAYDPRYYNTQPDPYIAAQHPPSTPPAQPRPQQQQQQQQDASHDFGTSGAGSFRDWANRSFSFGGSSSSLGGGGTEPKQVKKPIAYKHERNKMVKFRDSRHTPERRVRPVYSPVQQQQQHQDQHSLHEDMMDMEPQPVDSDPNASLLTQVANHILGNFGSWDTTMCWGDTADEKVPFPHAAPSIYTQDTTGANHDTTLEWEGQEVQLVDERREDDRIMPPPPPRETTTAATSNHSLGGFSSLGSCHSWLPEQMGAAASYFSGRDMDYHSTNHNNHNAGFVNGGGGGSTANHTETYSLAESIGGNSLSKIFEGEASPSAMNHRSLNQVPSWERSLRSRSPLSLGDNDDESLISKTSSKGGALSPVQSVASGEMAWTRSE